MIEPNRLRRAYEAARDDLLAERSPAGHWIGQLSSSALSTATAVSALSLVAEHADAAQVEVRFRRTLITGGLEWLAGHQNPDGGWGDTDKSLSNIATTMLVRAAFHLAGAADGRQDLLKPAEAYLKRQGGVPGLRARYGRDKTFAVPILTNCALAGLTPWREVPPLPFELACVPHAMYRFLGLPVVSYAIPALVAIGQARYFHQKPLNPITRLVRRLAVERSLDVLERMQPASGGFLEATPLTSFVVMSLAAIGRADHPVVRGGVEFLAASVRDDGAWPIDTNLATWVTTLSINALAASGEDVAGIECLDWLLTCQHREVHPLTNAAKGGWGWSDLSGAVPDADDTPGALLSLATLRNAAAPGEVEQIDRAATGGIAWLLALQNRDGGWPTFCRGWGTLPFDRSGVDLTAHALRALCAWRPTLPQRHGHTPVVCPARNDGLGATGVSPVLPWKHGQDARGTRQDSLDRPLAQGEEGDRFAFSAEEVHAAGLPSEKANLSPFSSAMDRAVSRGLEYLATRQRPDGSWAPLWFGNQHHPEEENPVYGTARVLLAYRDLDRLDDEPARRGLEWLRSAQNADGGWGGAFAGTSRGSGGEVSSVEETAVAVEALASAENGPHPQPTTGRGVTWLVTAVESGRHRETSPIGFYFARLWYYERLYPLIFSVSALGRALRRWGPEPDRP